MPLAANPSRATYHVHAPGPQPRSNIRMEERSLIRYHRRATKRMTCSDGYLPHSWAEKTVSQTGSQLLLIRCFTCRIVYYSMMRISPIQLSIFHIPAEKTIAVFNAFGTDSPSASRFQNVRRSQ